MPIIVDPQVGADSTDPTIALLGDSGIVFGGVDDHGVRWHWEGDDPWSPSPAVRAVTGDRENRHGQWDATRFYGARVVTFRGVCRAPNHLELHRAKQRLAAAAGVKPFELRVIEPGFDRVARVRREGEVLWSEGRKRHAAAYSLVLVAVDPLLYSTAEHRARTGFPSAAGGRVWPATWPGTWDAVVVSGALNLDTNGTEPAPLRIRVTGPVPDVVIAEPATGRALTVSNPLGGTLGPGEWLEIDTDTRQVLLLGTGNRRSWAYGDWPVARPGGTELLVGTSAPAPDPAAAVEVVYRDVWI